MDGTCGTCGGTGEVHTEFWLWNLMERDRLADLGIDGENIKIHFHEIEKGSELNLSGSG